MTAWDNNEIYSFIMGFFIAGYNLQLHAAIQIFPGYSYINFNSYGLLSVSNIKC